MPAKLVSSSSQCIRHMAELTPARGSTYRSGTGLLQDMKVLVSCDLASLCSPCADALAKELASSGVYIFSKQTLPKPPVRLTTDQIVIRRGFHDYLDPYRADLLVVVATKQVYRHLAILILGSVFCAPNDAPQLLLSQSKSVINQVVLDTSGRMSQWPVYYNTSPVTFTYWPATTSVQSTLALWATMSCKFLSATVYCEQRLDSCMPP